MNHRKDRIRGVWVCLVPVVLLSLVPTLALADEASRHNQLGVSLAMRGLYEEAVAEFRQAYNLRPGDQTIRGNLAKALSNRGVQLIQVGSFEQARDLYREAIDLVPGEATSHFALGAVFLRMRDTFGAIDSLQRGLSIDRDNVLGIQMLAEAYYQRGDSAQAMAEWERALRIQPGNQAIQRRLDEVKRETQVEATYRTRESHHFRITVEGQRREGLGRDILQILERAYNDVGYDLSIYPQADTLVILYADADFSQVMQLPHWVGGVYSQFDGKIRVPIRGAEGQPSALTSVLYHEYTHAAIYHVTRGNIPTWLNEGLAVYEERRPGDEMTRVAARAAKERRLIPLRSLQGSFVALRDRGLAALAYAEGYSATRYLVERYGMSTVQRLLRRLGEGAPFATALSDAIGLTPEAFENDWRDSLMRGY